MMMVYGSSSTNSLLVVFTQMILSLPISRLPLGSCKASVPLTDYKRIRGSAVGGSIG